MESWKWALIGVGIAVFIAINAMVIYCLYYRRNTETINVLSKEDQEHQSVDSNTVDEGVVTTDPKGHNTTLQQQQHDYYATTDVQTALSPPRTHPILTKEKTAALTTPTHIRHEHADKEPHELRVFSLSPLHLQQPSAEARRSEKTNSMCSTSTTTDRSMTPFQHATNTTPTISSIWRGPTPPWTQHPNNRYRNSSVEMNKQKHMD